MTDRDDILICVPGQRLCLANKEHICGQGTYERQGYIYSMLAGTVGIIEKDNVNNEATDVGRGYNYW